MIALNIASLGVKCNGLIDRVPIDGYEVHTHYQGMSLPHDTTGRGAPGNATSGSV